MALNLIPNAVSKDYYIQNLQTRLYNRLCSVWAVDATSYNSFGRSLRNYVKENDGYLPQVYDPGKECYVDGFGSNTKGGMFLEDRLAALSFFGLTDPDKGDKGIFTAKMQLIFFVNLSKITPGRLTTQEQAGQRMDEMCLNDVRNYIQSNGSDFTVHDVYTDVDKVLERYSGSMKKKALLMDMHPYFFFRIDLELRYNPLWGAKPQPQILQPMDITPVFYIVTSPDRDASGVNKIAVGAGKYIWSQYGEGNTFEPLYTDGTPFLKGKSVKVPFVLNDQNITLPDYNISTGIWTKTGLPNGFNNADVITIPVTNYQ